MIRYPGKNQCQATFNFISQASGGQSKMGTTLYYFSGTGNSLKIARELASRLGECRLIPMAKYWQRDKMTAKSESIGFVFPMYLYGLPDLVMKFMERIDLATVDYIFAVVTRSGSQGCSLHRIETILSEKSKVLNAGFYINMPSNYPLIEEVPSSDKQKKLFTKANKKLNKIVKIVKSKGNKGEKDLPLVKHTAVQTNNNWLKDVYTKDEHFHVDSNCLECAICEMVCPVNNIVMVNNRPEWQHRCQQCFACLNFCPKGCIDYDKKTRDKKRYHHPDIAFKDIGNQKPSSPKEDS